MLLSVPFRHEKALRNDFRSKPITDSKDVQKDVQGDCNLIRFLAMCEAAHAISDICHICVGKTPKNKMSREKMRPAALLTRREMKTLEKQNRLAGKMRRGVQKYAAK